MSLINRNAMPKLAAKKPAKKEPKIRGSMIYLPSDLYYKIKNLADRECRSFTKQVEISLRKNFEQ